MMEFKRGSLVTAPTQDQQESAPETQQDDVPDPGAHSRTRARTNDVPVNSFTAKTWTKVLSVYLSVLLALTMFDAGALTAYADDAAASEPVSTEVAADEEELAEESGEDPLAWAATAQSHDLDADAVAGLLPEERAVAAEVVPIVTARTVSAEDSHAIVDADIAARVAPNVLAWGAPYQVQSGFHVKGKRVQAAYDLGNLSALLEGGYLGGSREGDRFALTLDAPFLYVNDAGHVTATFSEEEWRLRTALATEAAGAGEEGGAASYDEALTRAAEAAADPQQAKNAPRAAIFADAVPDGWSLWQEHGGDYVRVSDEQMAEGVSGRLVFVYEGNDGKFAADAVLPAFDLGFAGEVPADAVATVHFGYEAHSFTAVAEGDAELVTVYGDAKRASVASYSLVTGPSPWAAA